MKKCTLVAAALAVMIAAALLIAPTTASYTRSDTASATTTAEAIAAKRELTHAQEVWLHALEWCESRGNNNAINPEDLDGTPSYGAFQFKPSTLEYYAKLYSVPTTTLMDYKTQRSVVTEMILHRDEINWDRQFPWCVKKLGYPPRP